MNKNILVIGDSILHRQTKDNLTAWPFIIFNDKNNIKLISNHGLTSESSKDLIIKDYKSIKKINFELIVLHIGICDCYPRFSKNSNIDDSSQYEQFVSPSSFKKNIIFIINKFPDSKIILSSLISPDSKFTIYKNFNYINKVKEEVEKYNLILKEISDIFDNVYYVDLYNQIIEILKKYKKKFTYIFSDGSGHVAPKEVIKDKIERQKIINMYSEIWYNSLKKLSILSDILK